MENSASEQLALVAQARAAVADRLTTPWWYHPVLGLLLAGYLVALSFGDALVTAVAIAVFAVGCATLASTYRRLYGVWLSGLSDAGAARPWLAVLGVLVATSMATAWLVARWTSLNWPVWALAALVLVATVVLGRRCDAALRAQLRAGA